MLKWAMTAERQIRNFAIIAHIDHGKSTLADRLLEITQAIPARQMRERFLDRLELEQEKGVTIKLQTIRLEYSWQGEVYILNLIDTPGHVDFSYEVSRSLAACEGAVLLVDKGQGIQAQTLAHLRLARSLGLKIIPVVSKNDLNRPDQATIALEEELGFKKEEIIYTSGKTGEGVEELLQAIIKRIPPPAVPEQSPLQALVFDSFFDPHRGVVLLVKIKAGKIEKTGSRFPPLFLYGSQTKFIPLEIGYLRAELDPQSSLNAGEVGYLASGLKKIQQARAGDTVVLFSQRQKTPPLPGYQPIKARVFASVFPLESRRGADLEKALAQLALNDAALQINPTRSPLLGNGFRLGLLGEFHLQITRERLEREFNLSVITTPPQPRYRIQLQNKDWKEITAVTDWPDPSQIKSILEPWIEVQIITPVQYLNALIRLIQNHRGQVGSTQTLSLAGSNNLELRAQLPYSELLEGFYQRLKTVSAGYASFDYQFCDEKEGDIVRVDFLINHRLFPALSFLSPRDKAVIKGRSFLQRLKEIIPRQQFSLPLQAAIGGRIIARTNLPAWRKDVTAKLYGGDRTRKDKLLQKQKKGKKRLQQRGQVSLRPADLRRLWLATEKSS